MSEAPERIWAKMDRATVYMDGSSPLTCSTREFRDGTPYIRADLHEAEITRLQAEVERLTKEAGKTIAREELKRMAAAADAYNEKAKADGE